MTKEKKGFGGLDDLVSDISDEVTPTSPNMQPPKSVGASSQGSDSVTAPVSQEVRSSPTSTPQADSEPNWLALLGWVVGGSFLVFLLVVAAFSGNSPKRVPKPNSESVSLYAQGIPDPDDGLARMIDSMLSENNLNNIDAAAMAIDKARKAKPSLNKEAAKESRVKNSLGLKATKAGKDAESVKYFFEALRLNPYDQEIADNLGFSLYSIADYPAAQKAYFNALTLNPRRASAWMGLGKVLSISDTANKALSAFGLGFHHTKSPKSARGALLTVYYEDKNLTVRTMVGKALAIHYSSALVPFLKPILGNLSGVHVPIYLPTTVPDLEFEGKPQRRYALNNDMFSLEANGEGYHIPLATESDCRAMACDIGAIVARRVAPSDLDQGEAVELYGGLQGTIVKGEYRTPDHLVFRIKDVRYSFSLGGSVNADIEAANSALKFGAIPAETLASLPKLSIQQPPVQSIPETRSYSPPVASPVVRPVPQPVQDWSCNITFDIALETFGEDVTVELRFGYPGHSSVVKTTQSRGGSVNFNGLCPGSYFIAIGNSDNVSVTPVRDFVTNTAYRSSIRMQRGSGNVSSKRRSEL